MKNFSTAPIFGRAIRVSGILLVAAGLAIGYGAATATSGFAQSREAKKEGTPVICTVCHKRRDTLQIPCGDLEYRRHVAHGDTQGACPTSPIAPTEPPVKIDPKAEEPPVKEVTRAR
jgi:hypothetical protein